MKKESKRNIPLLFIGEGEFKNINEYFGPPVMKDEFIEDFKRYLKGE